MIFKPPANEYLVPFDNTFQVSEAKTTPPKVDKASNKRRLAMAAKKLDDLQKTLLAGNRHSVLLIFQGMDAAGKDSTIRAVMQGINPAGCQVFNFKRPSSEELDHDFLWRTTRCLPERGRIGIFNRSQYEEVLVVRVRPRILDSQQLPETVDFEKIWEHRYESICDQEKHLARNGMIILKFWLNLSRDEQRRRFLSRLDVSTKNWKFNPDDVTERRYWDQYMHAYQAALNATSRPWAPWYAIPADSKSYMRARVSEIVVGALESATFRFPAPTPEDRALFDASREELSGTGKQD
ncbi:MAG: polyphosphate kinase 2 family protein [Gammaproteobacteria bacterium]|nr:polyphosphate kinase 2 family protein [Gammaproteobacteria bacterium]MDH4315136.1 polyphosphate kinase 2 family protein [Gammaproteobacteria bacterium]MDH5214241.1 polyphosphate kinase 2 family protein [Gammaproteobacteria bacterium]MDH5500764.1 polyphosphate kinase 2 family protein [Gammaproteobacteria bacterium]